MPSRRHRVEGGEGAWLDTGEKTCACMFLPPAQHSAHTTAGIGAALAVNGSRFDICDVGVSRSVGRRREEGDYRTNRRHWAGAAIAAALRSNPVSGEPEPHGGRSFFLRLRLLLPTGHSTCPRRPHELRREQGLDFAAREGERERKRERGRGGREGGEGERACVDGMCACAATAGRSRSWPAIGGRGQDRRKAPGLGLRCILPAAAAGQYLLCTVCPVQCVSCHRINGGEGFRANLRNRRPTFRQCIAPLRAQRGGVAARRGCSRWPFARPLCCVAPSGAAGCGSIVAIPRSGMTTTTCALQRGLTIAGPWLDGPR